MERGTDSGSMLFVGFASGTAFGSTGAGATATAVAVPALAAADSEPADFDGVGFGGSATATADGAAAGAGFVTAGAGAVLALGDATRAVVFAGSGVAFVFKRFEMSAAFQRDFGSRRSVLRAMSRNGCGKLSGIPGSPAVSCGRFCVNDSTTVAPSAHESAAVVALPFVSGGI